VIYPLLVTAVAQVVFPWQANGSFVAADGAHAQGKNAAGSALIGQSFDGPRYFWSRISATSPIPFNAAASSGSNLGPTNPDLFGKVRARIAALRGSDGSDGVGDPPIPANWQIPRVAAARGLDESKLRALVLLHTERRQIGILGEPRVNVLLLNLALDRSSAR
jgi:K+-transporting ATPase ATPase C chain